MRSNRLELTRTAFRYAMAALYIPFGLLHISAPGSFIPIMPPEIPYPHTVVVLTGACEVAGGLGLLFPRLRKAAGVALALYAVCVFPANIYHALAHRHVPPLPDSWWYHGPRLLFQPVLVWWALFAGDVISWPWRPTDVQRSRS